MNKTGIEYLDYTWNPLAMRCTRCSPGCRECWHLRFANRLSKNPKIPADVRAAYAGERPPLLVEARLDEPHRVREPARIGVQFMGDLFKEDVPFEFIDKVFRAMFYAPEHTFQILTKRPTRMVEYFERGGIVSVHPSPTKSIFVEFPFDNVHLGVTICTSDELWKAGVLLQIPAAVHYVSLEPLLGPIEISYEMGLAEVLYRQGGKKSKWLDLVIVGAETGPGKRPMKLDWARSLRDQCQAAGVPFFFKKDSDGNRTLDGRLWEQMPT